MKKETVRSSYKNGKKFIKKNGNKDIEGVKEKLETLKKIDHVRRSMPTASTEDIGVLIGT